MEIRAYDEAYLASARNILGHAADFAIMTLNLDPDDFGKALMVSEASKQFAAGNPRYVAGMNGCELARQILAERVLHIPMPRMSCTLINPRNTGRAGLWHIISGIPPAGL